MCKLLPGGLAALLLVFLTSCESGGRARCDLRLVPVASAPFRGLEVPRWTEDGVGPRLDRAGATDRRGSSVRLEAAVFAWPAEEAEYSPPPLAEPFRVLEGEELDRVVEAFQKAPRGEFTSPTLVVQSGQRAQTVLVSQTAYLADCALADRQGR